jgi:hypothetical protein
MASSKKRGRRSKVKGSTPRSYSDLYKESGQGEPASVEQVASAENVAASAQTVDWSEEYGYVFKDLRHLALVSVVLFLGLLVVGYFL